ncbi:ribonuclease E inhibitor RraB [Chitinilyticum piscinae]|uniref:Ribonuclease E inhibitor RraB n=1 Tax=Chitinilyticum piscinae TaxID=2866724 RepID=A0A8J7FI95_9NEIS|nr:ribonuclease E inhibitor RraB [Chitinilyticum piscinae]MBE9607872.1 ribonuclease E inhibitor RraB [Chitinilyticum piscinae]
MRILEALRLGMGAILLTIGLIPNVMAQRYCDDLPSDANGDALCRLVMGGADLGQPKSITFYVAFPSQNALLQFGAAMEQKNYQTSLSEHEPWEASITRVMLPEHAAITAFEAELDAVATKHGGITDGWITARDE